MGKYGEFVNDIVMKLREPVYGTVCPNCDRTDDWHVERVKCICGLGMNVLSEPSKR